MRLAARNSSDTWWHRWHVWQWDRYPALLLVSSGETDCLIALSSTQNNKWEYFGQILPYFPKLTLASIIRNFRAQIIVNCCTNKEIVEFDDFLSEISTPTVHHLQGQHWSTDFNQTNEKSLHHLAVIWCEHSHCGSQWFVKTQDTKARPSSFLLLECGSSVFFSFQTRFNLQSAILQHFSLGVFTYP